jgi:hypothetical protein
LGLEAYKEQIPAKEGQLKDEQMGLEKLIAEETKLTEEIAKPKGLRDQVNAEVFKAKMIAEEIEYLKPLWYNTLVEKELLAKRREMLEMRKDQLEKAKGVAER